MLAIHILAFVFVVMELLRHDSRIQFPAVRARPPLPPLAIDSESDAE
jgi:hypothetical protein